MEKFVSIERVGQTFDTKKGKFVALRDIDLSIGQGEFVALIGHSGCGKSTLLNLIAGLTKPTTGVLLCDGREIAGPGPERAVVFQNHSLLPWLTCFENIYLAVERVFGSKEGKPKLKARTQAAIELVGLAHAVHKYPHEISGGMKQRVGIARALSMEPKVLLMDEPFGALDALTREEMSLELLRLWSDRRMAVLFVTHSIPEAVLLADRVVVMSPRPGRVADIVEVGLPRPRSFDQEGSDEFQRCARRIRDRIFGDRRAAAA